MANLISLFQPPPVAPYSTQSHQPTLHPAVSSGMVPHQPSLHPAVSSGMAPSTYSTAGARSSAFQPHHQSIQPGGGTAEPVRPIARAPLQVLNMDDLQRAQANLQPVGQSSSAKYMTHQEKVTCTFGCTAFYSLLYWMSKTL